MLLLLFFVVVFLGKEYRNFNFGMGHHNVRQRVSGMIGNMFQTIISE